LAQPVTRGVGENRSFSTCRPALKPEGVTSTAGRASGNLPLRWTEAAAAYISFSGRRAAAANEKNGREFTGAAIKKIGASRQELGTSDEVDAAKRIAQKFADLAARNPVQYDQKLVGDLQKAADEYKNIAHPHRRSPAVDKAIDDIAGAGVQMIGGTYQALRCEFGRQAEAVRQSDPPLSVALKNIKKALDSAWGRSISPTDKGLWQEANREWDALTATRAEPDSSRKTRLQAKAIRLWVLGGLALVTVFCLFSNLGWHAGTTGWNATTTRGPVNSAIPIVAGTAERQDVAIYLFGLGAVQAFNTVRVSSRVDGQLDKLEFQEGQDVHAGDVLARIDPRPFQAALRQMEANLRRDQAQLSSAKVELDRTLALATREFASRQNVDIRRSSVEQLEAAIEADQALIDNAKVQLEYTVIRAPINGRAGLRLVDEGNMIRASDPTGIVVLTQLQPIAVVFALPEEDLPKINSLLSPGVSPAVTAFGRDGKTILAEGVLATVDNVIDRKTGTFKLKAHFANDRNTLWPGQFVNARVHLGTQRGIVVSEAAVQRGPEGAYVFVIEADDRVAMRRIRVAQTENGTALLEEGLAAGERVVVEGQHRLQPGSRVIDIKPKEQPIRKPDVVGRRQDNS